MQIEFMWLLKKMEESDITPRLRAEVLLGTTVKSPSTTDFTDFTLHVIVEFFKAQRVCQICFCNHFITRLLEQFSIVDAFPFILLKPNHQI